MGDAPGKQTETFELLRFPQGLFVALLVADIARDHGEGSCVAALVAHGGYGEERREGAAVAPLSPAFQVANDSAAGNGGVDPLCNLGHVIRWNNFTDIAANDLGFPIAIQLFGGAIPGQNRAVEIVDVDGVAGGLHDGRQLTSYVLGPLPLDEIRSLTRQYIQQPEIAFAWDVRLPIVSGEHPQQLAGAADQGVDCTARAPAANIASSAGVPTKMGLSVTSSTTTRLRFERALPHAA